ncbi:MAG: tetratricopeptide repeat protein [Bdellovibrionales bacterium]
MSLLRHSSAVCLGYIALAFAVYGAFLNNPFMMDDEIQVVENSHIHSLAHLPSLFVSSTMGSGGGTSARGIYYKPLMTSYYTVIWHFFGAEPAAYRVPLLILHTLSAFLIFLLSGRLFVGAHARLWSFALGLIFLLHPVNAEVVLYIADAQDILYMFFGLFSLFLIMRLRSGFGLGFALTLSLTCAVLSKETGVLFLAIASAYACLWLPDKLKTVLLSATLVGATYGVVRVSIGFTQVQSSELILHHLSYFERLLMLPMILTHHMEILLIPWRLSLSVDFPLKDLGAREFWLPLLCILVGLVSLIGVCRRLQQMGERRAWAFFIGVLVLWFLLHSHVLVPLDGLYADRWLYLVTWAGPSLLLLWLNREFHYRSAGALRPLYVGVIASLILVGYAIRDVIRAQDWSDALALYQRELSLHPRDAIMNNNVGVELFRRGLWPQAIPYFEKATTLNPRSGVAWNNLGACAERQKNDSLAATYYSRAIEVSGYPLAFENFAKLLIRNQRLDEARSFLEKEALPRFPHNPLFAEMRAFLAKESR